MIRRRPIEQHHCALCAGLFSPTERVWWSRPASLTACSSLPRQRPLASAGFRWWRRDIAPTRLRGFWHVQGQTCANREGAVFLQSPGEGSSRRDLRPSPSANEFETGAGACTTKRAERRHHHHRHALYRLAAAHGAGLFCRGGTQEARAQAGGGEGWRGGGLRDACRQDPRRHRGCAECVIMRQQRTEAAAIEAEIARLRSLALDALRRRWRVVFGRTPPAALSKDLLGRM